MPGEEGCVRRLQRAWLEDPSGGETRVEGIVAQLREEARQPVQGQCCQPAETQERVRRAELDLRLADQDPVEESLAVREEHREAGQREIAARGQATASRAV